MWRDCGAAAAALRKAARSEHGKPVRETSEIERFPHSRGAVGDDADFLIDDLEAIAHRAVAQRAVAQGFRHMEHRRFNVARPGGQQHKACMGFAAAPPPDAKAPPGRRLSQAKPA